MISIIGLIKDYIYTSKVQSPKVYNADDTIDLIINKKLSVSRFGDGEFDLMLNINHPKFQKEDVILVDRLYNTFNSDDDNLMVCIPNVFGKDSLDIFTGKASRHWKKFLIKNRKNLYSIFNFQKMYGDSLFTRVYIDTKDKSNILKRFKRIQMIWNNGGVVVVEGRFTRFGVGNDLLSNAKEIKRILCPEKDAFDLYEKILNECKKQDKQKLFLLALGPTATVLAKDLCSLGYQAIDIGHLDIEYEWFLQCAKKKSRVLNKYVNETDDIITVSNDTLNDIKYEESIISRIY